MPGETVKIEFLDKYWKELFLYNKFSDVKKKALTKIKDQDFLMNVVMGKNPATLKSEKFDTNVMVSAIKGITDEKFLLGVVNTTKDEEVAMAIVNQLAPKREED